jgi:hypothetical protein
MAVEFDNLGSRKVKFIGEPKLCLVYEKPAILLTDQMEWMIRIGHPVAEVLPQHTEELTERLKLREIERRTENRNFFKKKFF